MVFFSFLKINEGDKKEDTYNHHGKVAQLQSTYVHPNHVCSMSLICSSDFSEVEEWSHEQKMESDFISVEK